MAVSVIGASLERRTLIGRVACGLEVVPAGGTQMRLQFGKGHLDRIEVGAIGRQEQEPGASLFQNAGGFGAFGVGCTFPKLSLCRIFRAIRLLI